MARHGELTPELNQRTRDLTPELIWRGLLFGFYTWSLSGEEKLLRPVDDGVSLEGATLQREGLQLAIRDRLDNLIMFLLLRPPRVLNVVMMTVA